MTIQLRPYQQSLIDETRKRMRAGCKRLIIQAPTGSGKTALTAAMLKAAADKGTRSWFLVHRAELVQQSEAAFRLAGLRHGIIAAGYTPDLAAPVQICSVQTLVKRLGMFPKPDMVVSDECFPAGTLVDGIPIEKIKAGYVVRCYDHAKDRVTLAPVVRTFKSKPDRLVTVHLSDGRRMSCTPGHPFYDVERMIYVAAAELQQGTCLWSMHPVRGGGNGGDVRPGTDVQKDGPDLLLPSVPKGLAIGGTLGSHAEDQHEVRQAVIGAHEGSESYANAWGETEDDDNAEGHWACPEDSRREREGGDDSSVDACGSDDFRSRAGREDGAHLQDGSGQGLWLSESLQTGYRGPVNHAGSGSGWRKSLFAGSTAAGQEEDCVLGVVRVDRVEVHERTGDPTYMGVLADHHVYNIEVLGHHNYFADGVLVHNCHHAVAGTWTKILAHAPGVYHIGLTATPVRLDGKGLSMHFDDIILGPTVNDLIARGYLADYEVYAPQLASTAGLHTRAGDYAKDEVAAMMEKPTITGDAIAHYKRLAWGKRAIVFASSIKHSMAIAQQFREQQIPAAHVDGDTERDERLRIMSAFRDGSIRVVTNVDLFGEGVDVPSIEAAILLRPTKSLGLYLQQVGRALRPSEGKQHAIIIDHVGAVRYHGLPDDPHEWTLDGVDKGEGKEKAEVGVKICPACFRAVRTVVKVCPCGHSFAPKPREIAHVDGELEKVDKERARRVARQEQGMAHDLDDLTALGVQRYGQKKGPVWARIVYAARRAKRG